MLSIVPLLGACGSTAKPPFTFTVDTELDTNLGNGLVYQIDKRFGV